MLCLDRKTRRHCRNCDNGRLALGEFTGWDGNPRVGREGRQRTGMVKSEIHNTSGSRPFPFDGADAAQFNCLLQMVRARLDFLESLHRRNAEGLR